MCQGSKRTPNTEQVVCWVAYFNIAQAGVLHRSEDRGFRACYQQGLTVGQAPPHKMAAECDCTGGKEAFQECSLVHSLTP